jgi:hypothetical protein
MESHRILTADKVKPPLGLPLEILDVGQLFARRPRILRRFDGVKRIRHRRCDDSLASRSDPATETAAAKIAQ